MLNKRQEKFCIEYLVDLNATQAAIRAGYSELTAYSIGSRLLKKVEIKNRIKELQDEFFKDRIMSIAEVEGRLAALARGEVKEEVVVVEGTGEGCSRARIIQKHVDARAQLKALELIGKRNNLFSADTAIEVNPIMIVGGDDVAD
jgi:phage terminase small subunit